MAGQLAVLRGRDREAVGAGGRAVEGDVEALEHLVGQLVLEPDGELVGLVPLVAEHVGEEALDDAVAADRGDGGLLADGGEASRPGRAGGRRSPRSARRFTIVVTVPGDRPSTSASAPVCASEPSRVRR